MSKYKAVKNSIEDTERKATVAIVLPVNCSRKAACAMAAYAAQQMNHEQRAKATTTKGIL